MIGSLVNKNKITTLQAQYKIFGGLTFIFLGRFWD